MTYPTGVEKRQLNRLLCNDQFADCILSQGSLPYDVQSVNYNHMGIRIFSIDRLQETNECRISFNYEMEDEVIRIRELPCTIRYRNETDVGNSIGIRFDLDTQKESPVIMQLRAIEASLKKQADDFDRYGLIARMKNGTNS